MDSKISFQFKDKGFTTRTHFNTCRLLSNLSYPRLVPHLQPHVLPTLSGHYLPLCYITQVLTMLYSWLVLLFFFRVLGCTVVTAIFATNACFVYLLSWVFLHEQFVGIRVIIWVFGLFLVFYPLQIFAIILSITGISLIAYMDGVKDFQTLISVILASGAGRTH